MNKKIGLLIVMVIVQGFNAFAMESAISRETDQSLKRKIHTIETQIAGNSHNPTKARILTLQKAELENVLLKRENRKLKEMLLSHL